MGCSFFVKNLKLKSALFFLVLLILLFDLGNVRFFDLFSRVTQIGRAHV